MEKGISSGVLLPGTGEHATRRTRRKGRPVRTFFPLERSSRTCHLGTSENRKREAVMCVRVGWRVFWRGNERSPAKKAKEGYKGNPAANLPAAWTHHAGSEDG